MKIKYLAIVAGIVLFTACNKSYQPKHVDIEKADDSICYSMGVMTGAQLLEYINAKNDSVYDGVEEVLKGLRKGMDEKDEFAKYEMIGENIAAMIKNDEKYGMMGDSALIPDKKVFIQALVNALLKDSTINVMNDMEASAYLQQLQQEIRNKENERLYGDNRRAGEEFLEANKQRPEVIVTESGLQYEILKAGKGEKPAADSRVRVHYHGTLIDGTVFDSSVDRGTPAEFAVLGVIPGWTEALQLMPKGSKWKLYIPWQLAYGDRGSGGAIKPYSALIFEVELLDILKD